ncbi:hypothetical protein ON021_20950, partial [Microcoleus sp. HI-ES]|nr:hypothetical protein [Microcoleus sp. HI-ES]
HFDCLLGWAGFRDCLFQGIMVGKTRPYDRTNYTIANQRDMILDNSIIHPCISVVPSFFLRL